MIEEENTEIELEKPKEAPETPKEKAKKEEGESWNDGGAKKEGEGKEKAKKDTKKSTSNAGPKLAGFSLIAGIISSISAVIFGIIFIVNTIISRPALACLLGSSECCFILVGFVCAIAAIGLGIAALVMKAGNKNALAIIGLIFGVLWGFMVLGGVVIGLLTDLVV